MRTILLAGAAVIAAASLSACSSEDLARANIVDKFGADAGAAYKVAMCESRLDLDAVSPTNDHGLFQINIVHRADFERVTGRAFQPAVYDPHWNSIYAKWLYDRQGWRPWSCRTAI